MIAVSFVNINNHHNPGQIDVPASFIQAPSLTQQRDTDAALHALMTSDRLGQVMVDAAVAALVPGTVHESDLVSDDTRPRPDTVIWFVRGFQAPLAIAQAEAAGLRRRYQVPGTSIRVASNRQLENFATLAADAP